MGSQTTARAVKRLMKDLKEIREHPLQDVAASPLEDNLLVWHVNCKYQITFATEANKF